MEFDLDDNINNEIEESIDDNNIHHYEGEDELTRLDNAIENLQEAMYQYVTNVNEIWNNLMIPFLQSTDCLTLNKLTKYDDDKFLKFMMKQNAYKYMENSFNKLLKRRQHITTPHDK